MKLHFIYVIITILICQNGFGQQDVDYYQKGIEVALDSLIQKNPKIKFSLIKDYVVEDTSKELFGGFECEIDFDDLKQDSRDKTKIIIPERFKKRMIKNNFLNRIIYGKNLVQFTVDILFKDSNHILFIADFYGKEGGVSLIVMFRKSSLEVYEFCEEPYIY